MMHEPAEYSTISTDLVDNLEDGTIPGLVVGYNRLPAQTTLEREAVAHMDALNAAGRLNAGHRLLVALIIDLARTVGMGAITGKAAGVALASKQLLDAMDRLPALADTAEHDEWAEVLAALGTPVADQ